MEYRDKDFSKEEVILDGNTFTGCTFRGSRLVFAASAPVALGVSHFDENVQWIFNGAAQATLEFLSGLYRSGDEGGRQFVEQVFESIRRGDFKSN